MINFNQTNILKRRIVMNTISKMYNVISKIFKVSMTCIINNLSCNLFILYRVWKHAGYSSVTLFNKFAYTWIVLLVFPLSILNLLEYSNEYVVIYALTIVPICAIVQWRLVGDVDSEATWKGKIIGMLRTEWILAGQYKGLDYYFLPLSKPILINS